MKQFLLFVTLVLTCSGIFAQQNLTFVSQVQYPVRASDVWGYTAPDGTEYALCGVLNGVSVVSLADPANPVEVAFVPGANSIWRDMKTWGHFAYVTADQNGTKEGLLVIDLSDLPSSVSYFNWRDPLPGGTDSLNRCHNLWIDEHGYAYLSGCNLNGGGIVFVDVASEPGNPKWAGAGAPVYSHDCFTKDNKLFSAEIYKGGFAVYDVSDKANPVLLASQSTPFTFCHNVWLSEDGKTAFTTDERSNAPTAAYDVSKLDDIRFLDEFRPPATLGLGVIPHNVHVKDDYLVISHYTDGCVVVDASRPENLVQVGNYDSSTGWVNGFHGAWGAYPFFPSGLIAISDIENGLIIVQPNYVRACWLEGKVLDAVSGAPVVNAEVVIQSPDANHTLSDIDGEYKTGQAMPGTFEVAVRAKGYFDATAQATLVNGQVTLLDIAMTPLPAFIIQGKVQEKFTGIPVAEATVYLENQDFAYTAKASADGSFTLPAVLLGDYTVYIGAWGYENAAIENKPFGNNEQIIFELALTYQDNFNLDLGWTASGNATDGQWERGIPKPTYDAVGFVQAGFDSPNDFGTRCYVTGNKGETPNQNDVDGGETILTSQPMSLGSRYNRPVLSYETWFYPPQGDTTKSHSLDVLLSNGSETIVLESLTDKHQWRPSPLFDLVNLIDITDNMRVIFRTQDTTGTVNHIVEAGVDNFKVVEGLTNEAFQRPDDLVKWRIYPNPFRTKLTLDYKVMKSFNSLKLLVFNVFGQKVEERSLTAAVGSVQLQPDFPPGVYFVAFRLDDRLSGSVRVVKQ
jgi:choice-of-anchor B domain-containing protein